MKKPNSVKCFVLVAALFTSGCAATQDGKLAQGQGAALGTIVGGLLGYAIGGGGAEAILAGAALGGGAGFLYGTHIASKKAQYASHEAWLDASIEAADAANQQALAKQQQLRPQLAALETRAKEAKAANNAREMAAVRRDLARVSSQMEREVEALDKQHQGFTQILEDPDAKGKQQIGGLRSAVHRIDSTRASYRGDIERVASLNNSLDV